jgi:hypothetical protein
VSAPKAPDYARPYRPGLIALANRVGAVARGAGLAQGRLDAEALMAAARRRTGLTDFGPDDFVEPLRVLIDSIEREAALTAVGRYITRTRLIGVLANRLRVEALTAKQPAILAQPIRAPVIIAGLPRTGTTMLHRLLAVDPGMRALASWEALNPAPLPRRPWHRRDPRIFTAQLGVKGLAYLSPEFFAIHPIEAEAPEEEVILLDYAFRSTVAEATLRVPSYAAWLEQQDQTPAYRYMYKLLQVLQWQRGPARWVLKTPHHLEWIDTLLAVFPDATIVQTHRDPAVTLASICSMIAHGRGVFSDAVDPLEVGRHWRAKTARMIARAMAARDRAAPERFVDVSYYHLLEDPQAEVRRIYAQLQRPLTPACVAAMTASRRRNVQHKHGVHRYSLASFGIDAADVQASMASYRARFAIPTEG